MYVYLSHFFKSSELTHSVLAHCGPLSVPLLLLMLLLAIGIQLVAQTLTVYRSGEGILEEGGTEMSADY